MRHALHPSGDRGALASARDLAGQGGQCADMHHAGLAVRRWLERQLAAAVNHGALVFATLVSGSVADAPISGDPACTSACSCGRRTHALPGDSPTCFLFSAFNRSARSFQRCFDGADVALKLSLHPPAHERQRQPQRPTEPEFNPECQASTVAARRHSAVKAGTQDLRPSTQLPEVRALEAHDLADRRRTRGERHPITGADTDRMERVTVSVRAWPRATDATGG